MVFKLSNTWSKPSQSQTGFPTPGAGAQTTGQPAALSQATPWDAKRPTQGVRSFFKPSAPQSAQRGFPTPLNPGQRRPIDSMPARAYQYGLNMPVVTPYYSRGAAATVQNYGKVLTDPIGAGVVVRHRPQASYGLSGQYFASQIFWTSQVVPTSINLQGLTDPQELAAILDSVQIQAVVRTTG